MGVLQKPVLIHPDLSMNLPLELIRAVNRTYLLHLLTIDPDTVLPPGKSLIAVITQENLGRLEDDEKIETTSPHKQVTKVMQRAFWDVTAEKLDSSSPSEQNVLLQQLLADLHQAVSPLLSPQDALLRSLSLPPPPSTAPLYSFVFIMKEVLIALRRRCAPIRDREIDRQLEGLEILPPMFSHVGGGASAIASLITYSLEALMTIIDHMKSDLHDFLLGSMNEEQLGVLLMREAKLRERAVVVQLWSPPSELEDSRRGEDVIRDAWRSWYEQTEGDVPEEHRWKARLLQALFAAQPVSCTPSLQVTHISATASIAKNELPPQLFFSSASLYRLQDYLQAVVIAAILRSLIRLLLPVSLASSLSTQASVHDFMQRVWTLLEAELNAVPVHNVAGDNPLKLINLEDEVVRASKLIMGTLDPREEQRLRLAVGRTLRPSDPVFSLLQKRLMDTLLSLMVESPSKRVAETPELLKAGRRLRCHSGKKLRLMISDKEIADRREVVSPNTVGLVSPIKGFEDPVLSKVIEGALTQLSKIIGWTESVWGDLI